MSVEKKRTWQSIAKENERLKGIIMYLLSSCPKCDGSRKMVHVGGRIYDCRYCGDAWRRYENATGEIQISKDL